MDFQLELETLLRARFALIGVVTQEESRLLGLVEAVCLRGRRLAEGRAQSASFADAQEARASCVPLELSTPPPARSPRV